MIRQTKYSYLFLCLFLWMAIAVQVGLHAEPEIPAEYSPLKLKVSLNKFEELVMHVVSEIPELKPLWRDADFSAHAFLGGGALRGVMHWVYVQLQGMDPYGVMRLPVPSLRELVQDGADVDIFVRGKSKNWFLSRFPGLDNYDIIDEPFYQDSIRSGGATLEKVRVCPHEIQDPLEGFNDYYEGKMDFHWTHNAEFRHPSRLIGNTRLAQALRFLRFSYEMPEARVLRGVMDGFKKVKELEMHQIERNSHVDWWVNKGLVKLYKATGGTGETLKALKRAGLLPVLSYHGYSLGSEFDYRNRKVIKISENRIRVALENLMLTGEFDIQDLKYVENMNPEIRDNVVALGIPAVETAENFINLFEPVRPEKAPSPRGYLHGLDDKLKANLDFFFSLKPTVEQVSRLRLQSAFYPETWKLLMERGLSLVSSKEDYSVLVHPGQMAKLLRWKAIKQFCRDNPYRGQVLIPGLMPHELRGIQDRWNLDSIDPPVRVGPGDICALGYADLAQ